MKNLKILESIFQVYIDSYFTKKGKLLCLDLKNYKEVIAENFEYNSWLSILDAIRNYENKDDLQNIYNEIYKIADKAYFQKFYREISLEEKVKSEAFSFDVSRYRVNASFLN